ncbi:ABC transporter permease [Neorhizobium alkalisoli]|uniref:Monosaccharide ABC transporter membrane protein (CUT2 family) n=1 Tax=Neorhizobium alkalisoli TaxID=528178 RepID=A0A561R953_9HYPH|nr:ABC transporter permease [Neorhizobium alkalisoli]TWF59136.1 monosaccharide ABC transporter membrane protein (CUT2 family) [Neorhizobium alkalisoli]
MTVQSSSLRRFFRGSQVGLFVVIGLLILLFVIGVSVSDRFATSRNILNVYEQSTGLALVSLGQTLAILTGGIDLSVGSIISLSSMLTSGLINGNPSMVLPVIAGVLLIGIVIGAINGGIITVTGVHPLIVTLGTGAILQGITLLYGLGPTGKVPRGFDYFAYGRLPAGFSVGATFALVVFLLAAFLLRNTRTGRHIYAVGDDPHAATLMGLPTRRVIMLVYILSGFFASLTAIYLVSRFGVGQPYTGANYTLSSITPVVVGGTMLAGGRGGVLGTLLGVYLVSLLNNLLNFLDVSTHFQLVAQGLVIIAAVSLYVEKRRIA